MYQYGKDHPSSSNTVPASNDPFGPLLSKLNGTPLSKPRKPIPYNLWSKANTIKIDTETKRLREQGDYARSDILSLRGQVTRDLYAKLPKEVRSECEAQADAAHLEALEVWSARGSGEPSMTPADRQK